LLQKHHQILNFRKSKRQTDGDGIFGIFGCHFNEPNVSLLYTVFFVSIKEIALLENRCCPE
jgi:hypothetical protein